jgi:hypothetical protein
MAANKSTTTSIYVIRSKAGPVKIGIAARPRNRLSQLRTSSHLPLFLDYAAEVPGNAKGLEDYVHKMLKDCRLSGEWFDISSDDAVAVILRAGGALGYHLERTDAAPTPKKPSVPPQRRPFKGRLRRSSSPAATPMAATFISRSPKPARASPGAGRFFTS